VTPRKYAGPRLTGVSPELESKALLQRVKRQVAARALGVVVRGLSSGHRAMAAPSDTGGLEATAGNSGGLRGGAESSTGEHLRRSAKMAIGVL
jgi:hypothetical protein